MVVFPAEVSLFKGSCDSIGHTCVIQDSLPFPDCKLVTSVKAPLPHKVTFSGCGIYDVNILEGGGDYPAYHSMEIPSTEFHSEKVVFKCAHDLLQVSRNVHLGILKGRVINSMD